MNSKSRYVAASISLLVVFAITQVCTGASFAGSPARLPDPTVVFTPQQPTGILTTHGNKEITVNGAPAISGATIVSGATLETPEAVGSSVQLGSRGTVEISAGTRLTLEFSQNSVKAMLLQGCVVLLLKRGTTGEIDTPRGVAATTASEKASSLNVCLPAGATTPIINSGGVDSVGIGSGPAGAGIGGRAILGIFAGAAASAVIIPKVLRGENPSPSGL